jgi:hypothetical protein
MNLSVSTALKSSSQNPAQELIPKVPSQTVVTELPSPSKAASCKGQAIAVSDESHTEVFESLSCLTSDRKSVVSIGIQCCVPDLLFVNAVVPKTLVAAGYKASLPPFGDRKPPTFNDPITDGRRGNARDLGNMGLKSVSVYVQDAMVIRQPRDGSCLYHALIHGLGHSLSILDLRKELVGFVRQHFDMKFHGQSLETWIKWECCCRLFWYCVG